MEFKKRNCGLLSAPVSAAAKTPAFQMDQKDFQEEKEAKKLRQKPDWQSLKT